MAKTSIATAAALAKEVFIAQLFQDNIKKSYFGSKFMSEKNNDNSIVHVKGDLSKEKGEKITFGIRMRLTGNGVVEGQTLEGNEESLTHYDYSLTLGQYRHAVRDDGAMTRQRPAWDMSQQAKNAIQDWGTEKIDKLCFDAVTASPTYIWYSSSGTVAWTSTEATATAAITAIDLMTPDLISKVKTFAKTGGNRSAMVSPLRPVKINGGEYYVLIVHDDVADDICNNSVWSQAQREAQQRGKENPIFTGALGIWRGVVIHSHENVPIATNWGSGNNVAGAKNIFMGAQAICWAWGRRPHLITKKFDYDNEEGYAWDTICKAGKPVFNSKDYGSIAIYTARTQISDKSAS